MGGIAISANFALAVSAITGAWGIVYAVATEWTVGSALNIGLVVVGFVCWAQLQWADSRRRAREKDEQARSDWNKKRADEMVEERLAWRMELRDALEKNERLGKDNAAMHQKVHNLRDSLNAAQLQMREMHEHISRLERQIEEQDRRHRGEH